MPLSTGDKIPSDTKFSYVPYSDEHSGVTSCGIPITYDATKEWAGKKVIVVAVPGAFTPGCQGTHLPGFIEKLDSLKAKGVDIVAVIAMNDAWVMSAWGKANGIKDEILFLSDGNTAFSSKFDLTMGDRTGRYAMLVDDLVVKHIGADEKGEIVKSTADAMLAKL